MFLAHLSLQLISMSVISVATALRFRKLIDFDIIIVLVFKNQVLRIELVTHQMIHIVRRQRFNSIAGNLAFKFCHLLNFLDWHFATRKPRARLASLRLRNRQFIKHLLSHTVTFFSTLLNHTFLQSSFHLSVLERIGQMFAFIVA